MPQWCSTGFLSLRLGRTLLDRPRRRSMLEYWKHRACNNVAQRGSFLSKSAGLLFDIEAALGDRPQRALALGTQSEGS